MKYSKYFGRKSYCGKKRKSSKKSHNNRKKSRKYIKKGYIGHVGGDRRAVTTRRVTRRHGREIVERKSCMRNWIDIIYKLGKARTAVDVLLQRIDLVRQSGKYVPYDTDQWKHVINLKRRKYRFENPVMNLTKEAIDPVDGFITQQVNMEMSRIEHTELTLDTINDAIERNIDSQNYVRVVKLFNYILHKFVYDNSYLYKDDGGDIILVRESEFVGLAKEIGVLGSNIVQPVLVKKKYKKPQQVQLAKLLNKVRPMIDLLSAGRYQEAEEKAKKLIKYYCESSIIKKVLKLIEIYENQFISLIPFLPNYMFDHDEARASSDAGIEYDTIDIDGDNVIIEETDLSDMEESDDEVEDMGDTDGEEAVLYGEEYEIGGPHPDAGVPDDF